MEYAWVNNVCLEVASTLCGTVGKQLMRIGKLVETGATGTSTSSDTSPRTPPSPRRSTSFRRASKRKTTSEALQEDVLEKAAGGGSFSPTSYGSIAAGVAVVRRPTDDRDLTSRRKEDEDVVVVAVPDHEADQATHNAAANFYEKGCALPSHKNSTPVRKQDIQRLTTRTSGHRKDAGETPKKSPSEEPAAAPSSWALGRSLCVLGVFINAFVGPFLDAFAYEGVAQSLITPLTGLGVVWNTFLAPCSLGEQLTALRLLAMSLILFGIVSTVCFAIKHEKVEWSKAEIEKIWLSWRTRIYVAGALVYVGSNLYVQNRFPKHDFRRGFSIGITAGALAGNMFCMKLLMELLAIGHNTPVEPDEPARQYQVFELAARAPTPTNSPPSTPPSAEPEIYGLLGCFRLFYTDFFLTSSLIGGALFFSISNAVLLAIGMRHFEVLYMVPLFEASQIIVDGLSAAVVMRDFDNPGPLWLWTPVHINDNVGTTRTHEGGIISFDFSLEAVNGIVVHQHFRVVGYVASIAVIVLGLKMLVRAQEEIETGKKKQGYEQEAASSSLADAEKSGSIKKEQKQELSRVHHDIHEGTLQKMSLRTGKKNADAAGARCQRTIKAPSPPGPGNDEPVSSDSSISSLSSFSQSNDDCEGAKDTTSNHVKNEEQP